MLIFPWQEIKNRNRGLTFDDVLLVPCKSDVRSRRDPQLASRLTQKIEIEAPFISANMDTVTEAEMAIAMGQLGGFGILHRFMSIQEQIAQARQCHTAGLRHVGASIGVVEDFKERAQKLADAGVSVITVDIAHGHSVSMIETVEWLKKNLPHVEVIAGNIATPEATDDLISAGADAVKVGIGPGSMCTTRLITGAGVPQLTAIALCAEVAQRHGVPVIADGGLRSSGDILKALCAGAASVMLGSLLAGTIETPGEIKGGRKQYRGMASKAAQVSWRGNVPEGMAAEGEATQVPVKGHVRDVFIELAGGIRSGMSYLNATQLSEVQAKARFIEMTAAGGTESKAHGL